MRKYFASVIILLFPLSLVLIGCEKETVLNSDDFAAEIQTFVDMHFPDHEFVQVVKDRDDFKVTYDVIISGGISLEFDKDYRITDLFSPGGLPDSVIPESILEYVRTQYPQHFIVEWELDRNAQQVELDNGLELQFDKDGEFLRIDID